MGRHNELRSGLRRFGLSTRKSIIVDDDEDDEAGSQRPQTQITLDDEELLERALNAENSEKFRQLWIGNTAGYPSHSEADQALANMLAFWTAGDERQMERLFNQSGLVREKWRNRPDYRERTIREAVKGTTDFYEP